MASNGNVFDTATMVTSSVRLPARPAASLTRSLIRSRFAALAEFSVAVTARFYHAKTPLHFQPRESDQPPTSPCKIHSARSRIARLFVPRRTDSFFDRRKRGWLQLKLAPAESFRQAAGGIQYAWPTQLPPNKSFA